MSYGMSEAAAADLLAVVESQQLTPAERAKVFKYAEERHETLKDSVQFVWPADDNKTLLRFIEESKKKIAKTITGAVAEAIQEAERNDANN